ncbi:MAG TPA: hypothetical protein ENJ79_07815 [Gammaproteobacteria bacterium]|nr:hypothetical protein [Gammaproteobacteria bacterium]
MSLNVTRRMPGFEGVAAGNTATLRCPIGLTYHQLLLSYSGVTLAQMDEIRVLANGEVIHRYTSGSQLDSLNQFEGRAAASGVIVIDFDRYNLRTRRAEEVTGLGTGDPDDPTPITTLAVEVDINSAATGPALSAKAVQSPPQPVGIIKKVRQFTYTAAASGDYEIADLPKGDIINKVYFGNHATVVYNSLKIERDNFVVFERTVAENELIQTDGVRVPQADYVVYDPTENGHGAEGLTTAGVNDLRFTLNLTNAGSVPTTVEYLGPLEV